MKNTIVLFLVGIIVFFSSCVNKGNQVFDGKSLSNWDFVIEDSTVDAKETFSVKGKQIHIKGEPLGYMYTKKKYTNYTLDLEYRWDGEPTNSGVFVMIEKPENPFPNGIECQLMHGKAGDFVLLGGSNLKEYVLPEGVTERPEFPVIDRMESSSENPAGEWNKMRVEVMDGVIKVYVNGVYQNIGTNTVKTGHIGLQSEGGGIYFRNLKLKEF